MYVVPPNHVIDEFASDACALLGATEPEIAIGFAGFLKAVAQAQANNLNRQEEASDEAQQESSTDEQAGA